jgi:CheY-like chemotaxis protein
LESTVSESQSLPRIALVADDDALPRTQTADLMRARGFEVVEAADGGEAIAAVMTHLESLAVVVLDLAMPNIDGFDVLTEIRDATRERKIPIVVVTGAGPDQAQAAMALGADQAVMKGATMEELGALVDLSLSAAA